jgi:hypothetical protein
MKFRYELSGSGWAECTVELGGQRATVVASYLSDALDSLAGAVVALLRGDPAAAASFQREPGEFRWEFRRVGPERVRVRVVEVDDDQPPGRVPVETTLIDGECRLRTFAGGVLSELQRLLAEHGEAGYRHAWKLHEFPSRRVSQLQTLLA